MDKPTLPDAIGRFIGSFIVVTFIVVFCSCILCLAWNRLVPDVFGGNEITLSQALAMIGVAWTLTAVSRIRA